MRNFEFKEDKTFSMMIHGQEYEVTVDDEFLDEVAKVEPEIGTATLERQKELMEGFFIYVFGEEGMEEIFGGRPTLYKMMQLFEYLGECVVEALGGEKPETATPYTPKSSGRAKRK